jgi:hypothetical protein
MSNKEYIDILNPIVKPQFEAFIEACEQKGYKAFINSSYRTFGAQEWLHEQDNRNAKPGRSKHNFGMAIDVSFWKNNNTFKKSTIRTDWLNTGIPEMAMQHGLFWGGNFTTYYDPIHFEIEKPKADQLIALKNEQGCEGNEVVFKLEII